MILEIYFKEYIDYIINITLKIKHHSFRLSRAMPFQTGPSSGDPLVGLMPPPRGVPVTHRATQSDITYRQVEEMESRASMDMEAKNTRIDNLQCVSKQLSTVQELVSIQNLNKLSNYVTTLYYRTLINQDCLKRQCLHSFWLKQLACGHFFFMCSQ